MHINESPVTVIVGGADAIDAPAHAHIEVLGRAATGTETIGRVVADIPDVLLLDVGIADPDARAVCRRVREWAPATRVLAVAPDDDERAYTTLVAGATGVILADPDPLSLADAIADVARGESVLPARVATRLLHDVDAWARRSADPIHPPPALTATEREVLTRIGAGVDPAVIAEDHAVTTHLVNLHAGYAVAKLHRYVLGEEHISAQPSA